MYSDELQIQCIVPGCENIGIAYLRIGIEPQYPSQPTPNWNRAFGKLCQECAYYGANFKIDVELTTLQWITTEVRVVSAVIGRSTPLEDYSREGNN